MKPSCNKGKTYLLYLLVLSCFSLLLGRSTPTTAQSGFLVVRYNGRENRVDTPRKVAVDQNGNFYVTGTYNDSSSSGYATIKYDPNGKQLWVRRYDGPDNEHDRVSGLVLDKFGNVYVTGSSYSRDKNSGSRALTADYVTIKYDTNGNQLWIKRYDRPINYPYATSFDIARDLALDKFGNVYVTGSSTSAGGYFGRHSDYTTVKYDNNGNQLWVQHYNGPAKDFPDDDPHKLVVDGAGNVYVTGSSVGSGTKEDYATIKYSR